MPSPLQPITILGVEDHHLIRSGLLLTLDRFREFAVVGEAADGQEAVIKCSQLRPAIVLMDLDLPVLSGIEAAKEIKTSCPGTRVLALTAHDAGEFVFAALAAGADGYCLKDTSAEQLRLAIMSINSGAGWLDPAIAQSVLKSAHGVSPKKGQALKFPLSAREQEVLKLIVDGMSNAEIATTLFITNDTVKSHMRHILEKLSVSDRTQAAVKALKQGLV